MAFTHYSFHPFMRKTYLYYTTLIFCLLSTVASAAPRLTVVAVVDGLTGDNLTTLRPYWQQGGLRTLSEEAYQTTIAYPHLVFGGNETTATLVTGTTPDRHGYTMDHYFLRKDRRQHAMLEDESANGIGTPLKLSARSLLSPTLTDQMRMRYPKAKIYAVGIHPETSLLLAGHAANACCWLDTRKQQWVATNAYAEGLTTAAFEQNKEGRVQLMAAHTWTPRMDIPTYTSPTSQELKKGFSYSVADVLSHAPEANTLVIELALAIQEREKLGKDEVPDLLMIQLNTLSPKAQSDRIASAEQEDMYIRLNQDLGFLMEQLDRRIGRNNYQLLVVGRPVAGADPESFNAIHMPVQQFSVDRAAALTGTYLMALYGHERWVDGGFGQCIYLNRTLIEQKRLNLETIQRQVANFLMEFEGVAIHHPTLSTTLAKRHMGDVVFLLQPGWQLIFDEQNILDRVIEDNPHSPLLFWSGTLRPMPQGTLDATDVVDLVIGN